MEDLRQARIERVLELSPHVSELTLAVQGTPLSFKAGQWLRVSVPVGERTVTRAHWLAEPPREDGHLTICVERPAQGAPSQYQSRLVPNAIVTFSGPHGEFVLPDSLGQDLLLVARFTGIVPIRCIVREYERRGFPSKVTLIHGAAKANELLYSSEFRALAKSSPRFTYLPVLLSPEPGWDGLVSNEMTLVHRQLRENTALVPYVCGLREMVNEVRAVLSEFGFPRRDVKSEVYG